MTYRFGAWTGILAFVAVLAGIAFLAFASPALVGAEEAAIQTGAPVYASTCKVCHGRIAEADSDVIDFRHATHMWAACSSCHVRFPHTPAGTETPDMLECWACHGLRHGPMGLIAGEECSKCHGDRTELRPESHTPDWAEEPHVEPAEERLRTECAMCHTHAQCDACHDELGVQWRSVSFTFDVGNGCLSCHGNPDLAKASRNGSESLYVTGIERSAHRDNTCTECHVDFNYTDDPAATPLYRVNAGFACAACHLEDHADIVAVYEESLHGQLIAEGDFTSATCASCHGGHDIARLDTDRARLELHFSSEEMCAGCHRAEWDSYDDYYHGAPYKRRAGTDTPACWDCHGSHEVRAVADPESMMYVTNAVAVCGECHPGSDVSFIEQSADLIHGRSVARDENPVLRWWRSMRGRG